LAISEGPSGDEFGATGAQQHEARLHVDGVEMVRLLGPQERLLTTIEKQ